VYDIYWHIVTQDVNAHKQIVYDNLFLNSTILAGLFLLRHRSII
jgi:hypothetical protein